METLNRLAQRDADLGGESEGGKGVASMRHHGSHVAEHERLGIAAQRVLQQHRQLGVPAKTTNNRHLAFFIAQVTMMHITWAATGMFECAHRYGT